MESPQIIPVAVIFGPTACGKTALAAHLFTDSFDSCADLTNDIHGYSSVFDEDSSGSCNLHTKRSFAGAVEIISADSVQVYRNMAIGSAQPPVEVLAALPHHLIGICDPSEEFSVADFVKHADRLCTQIFERGKLPIILGGTAFYVKHFMYGMPITPQADLKLRQALQEKTARIGAAAMHEELARFDPVSAAKLHINDEYRIIRAHEVYIASGKPLSSFELSYTYRSGYRFCPIFLNLPREELYRRIEMRVDEMFAAGLQQEVRHLIADGCKTDWPGMKAIGYREFFELSPDDPSNAPIEAVAALIKRNSKRYAKRQQTFFQSFPGTHSVDMTAPDCEKQVFTILNRFYT